MLADYPRYPRETPGWQLSVWWGTSGVHSVCGWWGSWESTTGTDAWRDRWGQLVYALRSDPSRLARNLARASSGDIHACTLPRISDARHVGWVGCVGFLRDRDRVEAWGTVRRRSLYVRYGSTRDSTLNHSGPLGTWCFANTASSTCRSNSFGGGGAMRKPSCNHTNDWVGCCAVIVRMVSSTIRASKCSKTQNALSLCCVWCEVRTCGSKRSVSIWLCALSRLNTSSVTGPGVPCTMVVR